MAFGILERGTLCCPFVFVRVSSSFEKHCGTIHTLLLRKFVLLSHHGQRPPILAQPFIHHFVQLVQRSLARSRTSPRLLKLVGVLLGARLGCSLGGSLGASLVCPTQHTTPHTPIIHTPEHPRTPPHTPAHPAHALWLRRTVVVCIDAVGYSCRQTPATMAARHPPAALVVGRAREYFNLIQGITREEVSILVARVFGTLVPPALHGVLLLLCFEILHQQGTCCLAGPSRGCIWWFVFVLLCCGCVVVPLHGKSSSLSHSNRAVRIQHAKVTCLQSSTTGKSNESYVLRN